MKDSEQSRTHPPAAAPAPREHAGRRFAAPEDVLIDRDLGTRERGRVLDAWKRELERASGISCPGETLRRIDACRKLLGDQER